MNNALFIPGGIYRGADGNLYEYMSTMGKNKQNDRDAGLRFWCVDKREAVTVQPSLLPSYFPHAAKTA